MRFAVWLRLVLNALTETKYQRHLEEARARQQDLREETVTRYETQLQQLRQDFTERLRDKDAVMQDLRVRLAVAETDAMREKLAKATPVARPVPEFEGPVSFQDEVGAMSLQHEEEPNDAV